MNADGELTVTATYTDDVMAISDTPEGMESLTKDLTHHYTLKGGDLKFMLGIAMYRDHAAGTLTLS